MTFIDLFAGIGGFRRGMEEAGHECVGFCEYDEAAVASYTAMHLATAEQLEYIAGLDKKKRRKEIIRDEYKNKEWYAKDICDVTGDTIPKADIWCFGAPCQDFSIAGKRAGLDGDRSGLVRQVFRILGEIEEEDRPEWIIYENVKGMLSSNGGWDFAAIILCMDELGYDVEWQNINSKDYVPQNRERVYTIGHLRRCGGRQILPVRAGDIKTAGVQGQQNCQRVISNSLLAGDRLGNGTYVLGDGTYMKVNGYHKIRPKEGTAVLQVGQIYGTDKEPNPQAGRIYSDEGISPCLDTCQGGNRMPKVICKPCLTPDRAEKRQQGRRFKEDGEEAFTLTAQDKHGVLLNDGREVKIRKLTPKECFRLQGWTDDYFEKAELVNSDSQLYKQAGNGVTVDVVFDIARRLK